MVQKPVESVQNWQSVAQPMIAQEPEEQSVNTQEPPVATVQNIPLVDTSAWKTYRNEEYGFEFKYPNDWSEKEFYSGVGSDPGIVCTQLSDGCYFSLVVNSKKEISRRIVLQFIPESVFYEIKNAAFKDVNAKKAFYRDGKTNSGIRYLEKKQLDEMISSCLSLVLLGEKVVSEKNENKRGGYFVITSLSGNFKEGDSYDGMEEVCTDKYQDPLFENVLRSFVFF